MAEVPGGAGAINAGVARTGVGRDDHQAELGRHAVEDYTETKTLNMHIGARTGWWMPR